MRRSAFTAAGPALGLLAAGFGLTFAGGLWGDERVTDLPLYAGFAQLFLDGALPYRDVAFEYPPLAAPLLALPGVAGTEYDVYRAAFAVLALASAAIVVLLTGALAGHTGGERGRALMAAAALPLLCGASIRTHFDLAPVALTLGALLLLCRGRPRAGFAVLGVGAALKLFPLVVAPVALAWLVGRGERRAALEAAAVLLLVVVTAYGAATGLSPAGTFDSIEYHLERPVQIESTPAAVLLGLDAVGLGEAHTVERHRSHGLLHPAADLTAGVLTAAMVLVVAALAATAAGRTGGARAGDRRTLVLASLVAVLAFAALGKVLSPQFLIWVVPLGALTLAWRAYAPAAAIALAAALTLSWFPVHYGDVVGREPAWSWIVAARDVVLLAATVLGAAALRGHRVCGLGAREPLRAPAA
jgi:Glycosyltransferase family 87